MKRISAWELFFKLFNWITPEADVVLTMIMAYFTNIAISAYTSGFTLFKYVSYDFWTFD